MKKTFIDTNLIVYANDSKDTMKQNRSIELIKDLMKIPDKVYLSQDDWLELVASIIYKRNELKNDAETKEFLMQKKSHLIAYYEEGLIHARNYGLI